MLVRVLFFGVLKDIVGRSEESVQLAPGATAASLFASYAERSETLRSRRSSILFARNREFVKGEVLLEDGDEVAFLPPVSGGSEGHIFRLTREAIDSRALANSLLQDEDGALVTFEGVVRNNTKGRATLRLEYECYEAMALALMERIGHEIAASHLISRIGVVHRLGVLEIGEASVAICVTAPHRGPAFAAALAAINRLKKEVPIWKKEFFADGAVWVEGEWDDRLLTGSPR